MKKAKIVLSAIALIGIVGATLATRAKARFSSAFYYTTTIYNAVATLTLTHAVTTNAAAAPLKYYTTVDGDKATIQARVTKSAL